MLVKAITRNTDMNWQRLLQSCLRLLYCGGWRRFIVWDGAAPWRLLARGPASEGDLNDRRPQIVEELKEILSEQSSASFLKGPILQV